MSAEREKSLAAASPEQIVEKALDARDQRVKAEQEQTELRTRAEQAEAELNELKQAKASAESRVEELEAEKSATEAAFNEVFEDIHKVLREHADEESNARATSSPKSAEEAIRMKLGFVKDASKALTARAERADELEGKLNEAIALNRSAEVESLLKDFVSAEELEYFQGKAAELSDDDYMEWLTDKKILVRSAKKDLPFEKKDEKKEGKEGKDAKAGEKHQQSEFGFSGSMPNPGSLRQPRHKIAGSEAGDNAEELLDNVTPENAPNLAGASAGASSQDNEEGVDKGMRSLAGQLFKGMAQIHNRQTRSRSAAVADERELQASK